MKDLTLNDRVQLLESDMFSALDGKNEQFDLIVSNPPYIRTGMLNYCLRTY